MRLCKVLICLKGSARLVNVSHESVKTSGMDDALGMTDRLERTSVVRLGGVPESSAALGSQYPGARPPVGPASVPASVSALGRGFGV